MRISFILLSVTFIFNSTRAFAEYYIGMTQQSEYEAKVIELPVEKKGAGNKPVGQAAKPADSGNAGAVKDQVYQGKIDKIDQWTTNAYKLLNDGSQEKWTEGLDQVYRAQLEDIRRGGLGYAREYQKFQEKKLPKPE